MTEQVPAERGFDFNQPTVVSLLYLASVFTGVPMLIGVVLAYIWKGEPGAGWEDSHLRYHIRSFWIGIALAILFVIPTVLTLGLAAYILYPLLGLWLVVRSLRALLKAQRREPITDVETWLW
ncbi:MAG: hypothetical protein H7268_02095 [Sandarakinorhabdus sp.]|nr:hypothetical protein [Sandarakinorhabdus sp.]